MNALTIQARLGLVFLAFVLLVLVSVTVTFWGLETQNQDALLVNLAGRQRMLMQGIAWSALAVEHDNDMQHAASLEQSRQAFEQTLAALQHGGLAPYSNAMQVLLPPPSDARIEAQLARVQTAWEALDGSLDALRTSEPGSPELAAAVQVVQQGAPQVVAQADAAVQEYESIARQKLQRLRWIQAGFLISALVLLAVGWRVTRRSVIAPLDCLDIAAARIGQGDLTTPVQVPGPSEMQVLGETFEEMRSQLLDSHQSLESWAETLEQRVTQRTQQVEALTAVSREIASHLDITTLLQSVTETARDLLSPLAGIPVTASLCLLDGPALLLNLQAHAGDPQAVAQCETPVTPTLKNLLFESGGDPEQCDLSACRDYCQVLAADCRISHLAVPLRIGKRVSGALCLASSDPQAFPADHPVVLNQLAGAAAVALENARLYEQAERLATLEERQRIAAEMHDGLLQTLSYMRMMVHQANDELESGSTTQAARTLQQVLRAESQAQSEIRRAIASLDEDFPLLFTLQEQLTEITENFANDHMAEIEAGEVAIRWTNAVNRPVVLPREQSEQVLRVAREALSNALQHAGASHIDVRLEQHDQNLAVVIQDDGRGFDPAILPEDGQPHFGLKIMQARARRLGGWVQITSILAEDADEPQPFPTFPGQGTGLVLEWPMNSETENPI